MRGYLITIDSLIGITFLMFALMIIASQNYEHRVPDGIYLKQLTLDTVTVLEKSGRIDSALSGEGTAVYDVLEATPYLACMDMSITDSRGDVVYTALKSNCNETDEIDVQVIFKPAIHNGNHYIIKTKSWLRRESE